jgi:hypothetical protein
LPRQRDKSPRTIAAQVSRTRRDPEENPVKLGDFRALTFDCYGTLIDWETGILAGLNGAKIREV